MLEKLKNKLRSINRSDLKIIFIVLTAKMFVFIFGFLVFLLFNRDRVKNISYWLFGIWNRWDANSYYRIALFGYTNTGERRFDLVFFPLYPALISAFDFVTDNEVLGAFLISGIASVAAGIFLYRLAEFDYSESVALSSVWFLFIFPTSYFLHIPYTESLFIALAVGSFLFARKRKWWLVGILGFLACTTRINGLLLFVALVFEVFENWRETRKFDKQWLWLGFVPAGFVAYLILNYAVTGSFFTFLTYQREHWGKFLRFPLISIWQQFKFAFYHPNIETKMMAIQELIFVGIGLAAIVFGWKYLRNSYRAWMILNWLLFVSTSFIQSVPRYTLTMFPIFFLFGLLGERRLIYNFLSLWSILFLALFISAFVRGGWAF